MARDPLTAEIRKLGEKVDKVESEVASIKLLVEQRVIPLETQNKDRDAKVKELEAELKKQSDRIQSLETLRAEARGAAWMARAFYLACAACCALAGFLFDHIFMKGH